MQGKLFLFAVTRERVTDTTNQKMISTAGVRFLFAVTRERVTDRPARRRRPGTAMCFYSLLRESGSLTVWLVAFWTGPYTFLFAVTRDRVTDSA